MKANHLRPVAREVLTTLDRLQFATMDQLVYWVQIKQPAMSKTLRQLCDGGQVSVDRALRPHIYSLTNVGRRAIASKAPKKIVRSAAVMRHICHRNQSEMMLRQRYERMTFQSRTAWFKYGLNPAHGEHGAKDVDGYTLVLLDDYLMDSSRIAHSWTRPHAANDRYWSHPQIRHWRDVVNRFVVVSTDEGQCERHQGYIEKKGLDDSVRVLHVEPLWENIC